MVILLIHLTIRTNIQSTTQACAAVCAMIVLTNSNKNRFYRRNSPKKLMIVHSIWKVVIDKINDYFL